MPPIIPNEPGRLSAPAASSVVEVDEVAMRWRPSRHARRLLAAVPTPRTDPAGVRTGAGAVAG